MDEGGRNKSSQQHGAHKRPAVDCPQLLEPSTSDPPYTLVPEPKSFGTDNFVMYLEGGEELAHTTSDDTAYLQEMDRVPPTHPKVNKMCKKFS